MKWYILLVFLSQVCACSVLAALDGYSPQQDPDQFHIQTDEDDERYFLYQTHNGQYRKERRLKDGSVVGTTGWVGADGYLRLQDYIADNQGYRIYKSKTVYVGENRPISESLQIAKTAPTDSGFGVTPAPAPVPRYRGPPRFKSTTQAPPPSSSYGPPSFPAEVSVTPPPRTYSHPTPTPQVYVSPNSIDSSTTTYDFRPTVTPITASEAATTSSPYDYDSSNTNTLEDEYQPSDSQRYDVFNPNSYRHADAWLKRQQQLQRHQQSGAKIGDGYTPQFSTYDGSAFQRNGFRYYLPKQYHEEENSQANERTGSFGYVDPFGIRRVIYYNTAPGEGFQIRKNNRYVGHDATPYDPRPVN
uniref:SFRICE_011713 n=1 Tax=Spodoptera frugiperda TaxID=7108 RepID=A0A2H1VDV7_SPOFR